MKGPGRLSNAIAALSMATVALVATDIWDTLHRDDRTTAATMTLIVPQAAQSRAPVDPDTGPTVGAPASRSGSLTGRGRANGDDDQDDDDQDDDDDNGRFDPGEPGDPIPI